MPHPLPDLLRFDDGRPVATPADWDARRTEVARQVVDLQYGRLPPVPAGVRVEKLSHSAIRWLPGGAGYVTARIVTDAPDFAFMINLTIPTGDGPFPVVLCGDGCWRYMTDTVTQEVVARGFILAQFNRTEIVPDIAAAGKSVGLYRQVPDGEFGALAAWAWGYHRCIDALAQIEQVDPARIMITGHSRGGKTVLLAGATDARIAVTAANCSGCGGAGCYRHQGPGSETLGVIVRAFPHWFSPRLDAYIDREQELPFDQHYLKALVAPRALLTCEALEDLWANPTGTRVTYEAARELFRFLGVETRIGLRIREGGHAHSIADWCAALDFATQQFRGVPAVSRFNDPV
jgi:dienelactone hydrolase